MNIIGIDISKSSTGMTINGEKLFNYCVEEDVTNKSGFDKWYKVAEPHINIRFTKKNKEKDYSEREIQNINCFEHYSDLIIEDILTNIKGDEVKIFIEGYSYSSSAGHIIDLVTLSTLIRSKILKQIKGSVMIISPSTLKLETCKLVYPELKVVKGKKIEWFSADGIKGGSFKKHDMYKAICDLKTENTDWVNLLREYRAEMMGYKNIPKPFDDVNDSYLLYLLGQYSKL